LNVWFDSGSSQAAVLGQRPELAWPADAYLEAVEQARGWFGSSLACAVAERGHAPFRSVISHGLTVDEQGRKMSKSLGNSEDAGDAVNRIGADVLRLVYASLDYTTEIALGNTIYTAVSESYRKIRNTCRFMLGNLADFDPARDAVAPAAMLEFDRYIMARTERLKADVLRAYEAFDYQAAYHALLNFIVVDLSSLYIDVARDRLYCDAGSSRERRSAQTALYLMLDTLLRMLAPLIPFTADEVYAHVPGKIADSVHLLTLHPPDPRLADAELEARWQRLLQVRENVLRSLENLRQTKTIGAPLDALVKIFVPSEIDDGGNVKAPTGELAQSLLRDQAQLKDLLIVSSAEVVVGPAADEFIREHPDTIPESAVDTIESLGNITVLAQAAPGRKCQRCWKYFDDDSDSELDARCRAVVQA
jgi:isoleucyl-tRNA synthetase